MTSATNSSQPVHHTAEHLRDTLRSGIFVLRRIDRDSGLAAGLFSTLKSVNEHPLSVGHIARLSGIANASASQQVNKLESEGLVRRIPDPEDTRGVLVEITENGRQALMESARIRTAKVAKILSGVTTEELEAIDQAMPILDRVFHEFLTHCR